MEMTLDDAWEGPLMVPLSSVSVRQVQLDCHCQPPRVCPNPAPNKLERRGNGWHD